jgi:penicillin amidase
LVERLATAYDLARLAWRVRRLSTWPQLNLAERLDNLPTCVATLRAPVELRWSERHVPVVEGRSERDAAVGLGVVHAHLRLFQIDLMRRLARGRLAEMFGAAALPVDRMLRVIDLPRAVPAIEAGMDDATRAWVEGFVEGLNAVAADTAPPPEYAMIDCLPEAWSVADVLALGRLAASDFSWHVWRRLVPLVRRPDWPDLWRRLVAGDEAATGLVDVIGRGGSNAAVVGPARSASGQALLASDPHLAMLMPNLFLAGGVRAPGLEAVGLMVPGLPVFGVGRNRDIAWGGTSLHAASSDLVDVTELEPSAVRTREETIRVRGRPDAACTVRDTPLGPIVSDAPLLKLDERRPVALRWIGHRANDEIKALVGVARAATWEDFRASLEEYAAPAVTMLYADRRGRIGRVTGAQLPRRERALGPDLLVRPEDSTGWDAPWRSSELPARVDPEAAIIVSANDRPPGALSGRIGVFYAGDDRAERLKRLLGAEGPVSIDDLAHYQCDVGSDHARDLARRLAALVPAARSPSFDKVRRTLASWDGTYHADSRGAAAFEAFAGAFLEALAERPHRPLLEAAWDVHALLRRELRAQPAQRLRRAASEAARATHRALGRYPHWRDMHRLHLAHPLDRLPGTGRRFRVIDRGTAGGRETLMKTANPPTPRRHVVRKGAIARFVADLGDVDSTAMVLLGGQDGWLGSSGFADQHADWTAGRLLRLPLSPAEVARVHPHRRTLWPRPTEGST